MVRPNHVKQSLKEGKLVVGTMIAEFRSPGLAQMMANAGFHFMSIDMEHSRFSLETVAEYVLAARGAGIGSIVRVPQKGIPHLPSRLRMALLRPAPLSEGTVLHRLLKAISLFNPGL